MIYQTDNWESNTTRVLFGDFDSRVKAIDIAKYYGLYCPCSKVVIEEIILNQFEEN